MVQTKEGAAKAVINIKNKHGEDFFRRIGAAGGAKSRGGGFAANPELARIAGAIGGRKSRRKKIND